MTRNASKMIDIQPVLPPIGRGAITVRLASTGAFWRTAR